MGSFDLKKLNDAEVKRTVSYSNLKQVCRFGKFA
jgi:hypothetical protein